MAGKGTHLRDARPREGESEQAATAGETCTRHESSSAASAADIEAPFCNSASFSASPRDPACSSRAPPQGSELLQEQHQLYKGTANGEENPVSGERGHQR